MTLTSQYHDLAINKQHVLQQFERRKTLAPAQFIYAEIAKRMIENLNFIRLEPHTLIDAGCGEGDSFPLLTQRYPNANYIGLDFCAAFLRTAQARYAARSAKAWLASIVGRKPTKAEFVLGDLEQTHLAPESAELLWSNMALHWHPRPHDVFAEWRRLLKPNGLVMFSSLGPSSFKELRQAVSAADLQTSTLSFVDMHDFGDLLVEQGFMDPVMDQETLTLTYRHTRDLLSDVAALGGNPAQGRRTHLCGRAWHERLCQSLENLRGIDGLIHLTLEVAYGHAWRSTHFSTEKGVTHVPVSAIGYKNKQKF